MKMIAVLTQKKLAPKWVSKNWGSIQSMVGGTNTPPKLRERDTHPVVSLSALSATLPRGAR